MNFNAFFQKIKYVKPLFIFIFVTLQVSYSQTFVHPGMLHSASDFVRMQNKVSSNAQPWKGGWDRLVANYHSSSSYSMQGPVDTLYRGYDGVHSENYSKLFNDAAAAYANALRWKIAGTTANADEAVKILNAWGSTLKAIRGTTDAALAAGIYGYEIANAAEIMRTYSGWSSADFKTFKQMMQDVFYYENHRFLTYHNGTCSSHYWANWDLCNMASILTIGILCDNRTIYNEAITYFKSGVGNGNINNLVNFIYDGNLGQWQESGRDQGHSTLGVSLAGAFCQMAWNQGDDMYGYDNNRLWKGFEYIAKYNLGNSVPYTTYNNCDNVNNIVISPSSRMNDRPVWELIYNHYAVLKGLYSPYIQIYAEKMRPEGGGGDYGSTSGGYDQLGYGTLTATLETGITKKSQTITFPALPSMQVGDSDIDPGASATSGNRCYYTTSNPDVAEIVNNKIHAWKCGTATITAWQVGDETYASATPVTQTITITAPKTYLEGTFGFYVNSTGYAIDVSGASTAEGGSVIQWPGNGGLNQEWKLTKVTGDYYKMINVNSGLALNVVGDSNTPGTLVEQRTYTGGNYQLWNIIDNCDGTIKFINKGNGLALGVTSASTSKGATYEVNTYSGANNQRFTYWYLHSPKLSQTISFDTIPAILPGSPDDTLHATASSGLPVTYTSTNSEVATVNNGVLHVIKGGTTTIVASQAGDSTYDQAEDVSQVLVTKKSQTIDVPEFPVKQYKDAGFYLKAEASSGLPVSVLSSKPSVAQYDASRDSIIIGYPGSTIITVTQQGDSTYLPAYTQKELIVNKMGQTITFPKLPVMKVGDPDYNPGAKSSTGMLVSYSSSDNSVAEIISNKIHAIGAGTCQITASLMETLYYSAADSVQTLVVSDANGVASVESEKIRVLSDMDTGKVQIFFPDDYLKKSVYVVDVLGRVRQALTASKSSEVDIDLSSYPQGIYFLSVKYGDSFVVRKIIKG